MKKIKKTNKATAIIALLLCVGLLIGFSSCKTSLDEQLYSSVPVTAFYKNQEQADLALNGVYGELWEGLYQEKYPIELSDEPGGTMTEYPTKKGVYVNFTWTISETSFETIWATTYKAINRANTLLDKLAVSEIPSGVIDKIGGQARFLRALFYFNLVKYFGGVPLYVHGVNDLSSVNKPRNTAAEVYQQIIKDLQDAAQELSPYSESDHAAGRATSGAALALLTKVYAQQQNWTKAAETAQKLISMKVFKLDADYEQILDPSHNNDQENIFSVQHQNGGGPTTQNGAHLMYYMGPAPMTTSQGKSILFFHSAKSTSLQANPSFFDTTPSTYRKWRSMRDKMPYYYPIGSSELVHDTISLNVPFVLKYNYLDIGSGNLFTAINFPILRYSDVLLTYAEALNEANNGPTPEAYDAINQVRARARGVGTSHEQPESVYPPLSGLNQKAFKDAVLTEEAREFVGEGHRRADLLRHHMFISDAKNRGLNATEKDTLYPIPVDEIGLNPNLKQNTGY